MIEIHLLNEAQVDFDTLRGQYGPDRRINHVIPYGRGEIHLTGVLEEQNGGGSFTLSHPELDTFTSGDWSVTCVE